MTAALVAFYVAQGRITGGGPADREHNASLRREDWRPYSIRIGDTYYSYIGAEPFSSVLSLVADATEAMAVYDLGNATRNELATAVSLVVANQLTDKTFMQGFSNLVAVLQDPTRYTDKTINNFARSIVPRAVAQVERVIDPTVRDARTILDQMVSQIPGLSSTLPPRRNIWGQAKFSDGAAGPDMISPVYSNTVGPNTRAIDGVTTEGDVELAYMFDKEFALVGYGPNRLPDEVHTEVALEPQERNLLHQMMGQATLDAFDRWSRSASNMKRYNERKKLYLETGNSMAFEKIRREFDLLVARARDSVLDISGFRYGGEFFKTEEGKQFRIRLDEFLKEQSEEMKSVR